MPKEIKREYDPANRNEYNRTVGQDEDLLVKGKAQDASGLGSKVKASPFVPPKMEPNEDSARYSKRVASAREAWRQKQAMK